jgi:pyridoxal phosphate enzyme (YggS family)
MSKIQDNYFRVKEKVRKAAERVGRSEGEIALCVITKNRSAEEVLEVVETGHGLFGENRVQEAQAKIAGLPTELEWHLVGHLQRNKAKLALQLFRMIHSVDSLRLAGELAKWASRENKVVPILIEVNTSGEETKFGVAPREAEGLIREIAEMPSLRVEGLMTMAPYLEEREATRPYFRRLRELREAIAGLEIPNVAMRYLSMGMTNDYEVAIEEEANLLRIGSAIFEGER